ncbi:hypothetical protein C8D91_0943 [Marinicella litoralis]|uniref:DUF4139 domain-containing protein n=2 Tax=Marinicella litoralis TaxID=644220 RepID=A0A4R6XXN9_9GAMM|nr:hypothetical protein C8D91_0943 [Marinicella litoralis]
MAIQMSQADNSITIYSGNHQGHLNQDQLQNIHNIAGFAVVKQIKEASFKQGVFSLAFDDVAAHIDPTTVSFDLPENPNAVSVLDQNFQFDLVSSDKLLQKYLDQEITVNHDLGEQSINTVGTLLSTSGGLTLKTADNQITTINTWNQIQFPELPGGLLTKPTLVWLLDSTTKGTETIELTYQTKGMTWWSDYIINLQESDSDCTINMTSWVTLVNKSGASFPASQLKLIAGDINRAKPNVSNHMVRESFTKTADNQFTEQSLFEYHLYKLPRLIDLPNNSTKQIQMLQNTHDIQCEKILQFNGSQQQTVNYHRPITDQNHLARNEAKIEAFLSFKNSTKNKLGLPLPAGRVRVNSIDSTDGSLEFIGEDSIDHTAKNKVITLKLGNSFDVTGKRKQKHYELLKNSITEQFEITIDNQKPTAQWVEISEPLYRWSNWTITHHNTEYEKINSSRIKFKIKVPAESSKAVTYTVQYQWPEHQK